MEVLIIIIIMTLVTVAMILPRLQYQAGETMMLMLTKREEIVHALRNRRSLKILAVGMILISRLAIRNNYKMTTGFSRVCLNFERNVGRKK